MQVKGESNLWHWQNLSLLIHCCHSWKRVTGRKDATCCERQCNGRREISRRHSGIVLVKYKHSVVGKTQYSLLLLPLQPISLTFPISPTSSQYGVFHPVGGPISFFVCPHFSVIFSIYLLYHSLERITFLLRFYGCLCSCMLKMHTHSAI